MIRPTIEQKIVIYGVIVYTLGRCDVSQEIVFLLVVLTIFADVMTSTRTTERATSTDDLQFWMTRPDIETTEWINSILSKMWPFVSTVIDRKVRDAFNENSSIIKMSEFSLGHLAPAIDGVQTFRKTGDSIVLDVGIRYVGDRSCCVGISIPVGNLFSIPVVASRFRFRTTIRLRCEGIGGQLPCIDRIVISIPKQLHEIDFSLYVLTKHVDLAHIPVLRSMWRSFLHTSLRDVMLWPRHVPIRGDVVVPSNINLSKEPLLLTVDVISGNDLPLHAQDKDITTTTTTTNTTTNDDTGTFYVMVLRISNMENRTNPSTSSSTIGNVCKETLWNESFSFRVRGTNRSSTGKSRVLLVSVYNSRDLRSHGDSATPVGLAKIAVSKLPLGRTTSARIPLFRSSLKRIETPKKLKTPIRQRKKIGIQAGWLILRLRLSPVDDENEIEDNSLTNTTTSSTTNKNGLKIVKVKHGTYRIAVIVHRCIELSNGSFLSNKCNPYVSVRLGNDKTTTQRSTTKFGSSSPNFEEKFEFQLRTKDKSEAWSHAACGSVEANIQIQVKSHNDLIPDEFLGMKRIKFKERDTGGRRKYKLKGSSSGSIEISVFWCR